MSGYRKLIVWIEAKKLTILTYQITSKFPRIEDFGLTSQMRRAAVSVMSQIAEGWIRRSVKDKLRYLEISEGSLLELENLGEIAKEVGYLTEETYKLFDEQRNKASYLLFRYIQSIEP